MQIIIIPETLNNQRIDIALSKLSNYSRSMIQKLIYQQKITLNKKIITKPNHKTQINEEYKIEPITNTFMQITPEEYQLDILFEDEYVIAINKPAELIVHPGAGNFNNTLINKLAHHCTLSNIAGPERLGTVHRLDKGVSGCIIFAKDNITHANLNSQFSNRLIKKEYITLAHNLTNPTEQYLENYIKRCPINRQKMKISTEGKLCQMHIKLLKYNNNISLIKCNPITGRTHQIRAQLTNINQPILNDPTYGKKETKEIKAILKNRIALHSNKIKFTHPKTKEKIEITTEIPKEFLNIINKT